MKINRNVLQAIATACVIIGALAVGAILTAIVSPRPLRAQFSAQTTWIPASGVGGGANAVTLNVPNITQLSDLLGVPLRFLATNTNAAGATTINPTGLGAVAVDRPSSGVLVPIAGGDFYMGTMAEVIYDGTVFEQTNPATGTAPVGTEADFTAGTAAQLGYLIENGTCISETTYLSLWNYYGNADIYANGSTGAPCAGGQFHLKFANGRASVAYDQQGSVTAGILTNAGSGCAATVIAVLCGSQNQTLTAAQLPTLTSTGNASNFQVDGSASNFTYLSAIGGSSGFTSGTDTVRNGTQASAAVSVTTTGTSGQAHPIIQPISTTIKGVKY